MKAPPVISAKDLYKIYHLGDIDVHALNGVSLDIEEGEFVSIMGASGSGKSYVYEYYRVPRQSDQRGILP